MNNEEIAKYIADERARGVADEQIKIELLIKGWKEGDVNTALGIVSSGAAPTGKKKATALVMSVVGIFLTVVMILFIAYFVLGTLFADNPRNRSRDAQRISDIGQIQLGLELYFDKHQQYPVSLDPLITEAFLPKMPTDPVDGTPYVYAQLSGGNAYALGASLEEETNAVLTADKDTTDTTFNTADTSGCHGESGRHCYDVAVLPAPLPQVDPNVIMASSTFTIPDFKNAVFTINSITKTHENGRPDLPLLDVVVKAENNGPEQIEGDFLEMFYVSESGQLRFAPHGVTSYGNVLEPRSEKNITYYFHIPAEEKKFVFLYGPYAFGSREEDIKTATGYFFVDLTAHALTSIPDDLRAQLLEQLLSPSSPDLNHAAEPTTTRSINGGSTSTVPRSTVISTPLNTKAQLVTDALLVDRCKIPLTLTEPIYAYGYGHDNDFGYIANNLLDDHTCKRLVASDGPSFHRIDGRYLADKNKVYYYDDSEADKITTISSSPSTFVILDPIRDISKDHGNVFVKNSVLLGVDPSTFSTIPGSPVFMGFFAKDANSVYSFEQMYNNSFNVSRLGNVDPKTFSVDGYYARDQRSVYFVSPYLVSGSKLEIISGVDLPTFQLLGFNGYAGFAEYTGFSGYARDKYHVYRKGEVVPGVDPSTFKVPFMTNY